LRVLANCNKTKMYENCVCVRIQIHGFMYIVQAGTRVTRWVCEKSVPNVAQQIFRPNLCTTLTVDEVATDLGYFCNFHQTAQSKQWPNWWKFAQSGHPGWHPDQAKLLTSYLFVLEHLYIKLLGICTSRCNVTRGPFLTLPLGSNFDPQGRSWNPGVNFVPWGTLWFSVRPSILLNST
jgi:hypothetical protein